MLKNKSWNVSFSVYVAEAIKKIFKLYAEADPKPKSIVLVGHSMVRSYYNVYLLVLKPFTGTH